MKRMISLALAAAAFGTPALSAAQSSDSQFASSLQSSELDFLARNHQAKASFQEKFECFLHRNCLKLKKDLVVGNNKGYEVDRVLVSSEFEPGSRILQEEKQRGYVESRYIGYALPAERLASGAVGFSSGKYSNKNPGYLYPKLLPWGEYGRPGIVAFEFLTAGSNAAFIADNGYADLPEYDEPCASDSPVSDLKRGWAQLRRKPDPCVPRSRGSVKTRLASTFYDSGVERAMAVEIPYDQLQKLLGGKVDFLTGEIHYYVRGGFQREVYDPYAFGSFNTLADVMNYRAAFAAKHRAELDAGEPRVKAADAKIAAMRDIILDLANDAKARQVIVRLSKNGGRDQTLTLEFPR